MCEHAKHRVDETHKRSIVKGITGRTIEIVVDATILSLFGLNIFESVGVAILIEGLCFVSNYFNERLWNKVSWGRHIVNLVKK